MDLARSLTLRLALLALGIALACGSAVTGGGTASDMSAQIDAPATATVGVAAAVSGTASTVNGIALTYAWAITPASCGGFDNAAAASTLFTAAQAGTCQVMFTATAGSQRASATASVVVSNPAGDLPPTIDTFSVPSAATTSVAVTVSATASDPNGDPIAYAWTATPGGCGGFASASAASTTFTPVQAGTCAVQLTVTANGKQASRSQNVTVSAPCTGSCGGTLHAVDPLPQPPNGLDVIGVDTVARPQLWKDLNPAGNGDLFGIVRAGTYTSAGTYYLLVSTSGGTSWSYLAATGGTAPTSASGASLYEQSLCQDTVGYKVHYATFPPGGANARYHRIALAYDASKHINGWSWETSDVLGPPLSGAGVDFNGSARVLVQEVLDGSGNHVLVLAGLDSPNGTEVARLVASRTVAGTTALAPTGASSWRKLTDSSTAGNDVLCAKNTDTSVDGAALLNLTSVGSYVRVHESDYTFAQVGADRSLHFLLGPMYYNDATAYGDIRRWRFTWSGTNWVNDATVNGAVVAGVHSPDKPCLGGSRGTQNYAWFSWGDQAGVHISRIGTNGAWTKDAVASPDTSASYWWYVAINVSSDESQLWAYWERNSGTSYNDYRRSFSGGAWGAVTEDTSYFNTPSASAYGSASAWSPVGGMVQGIGVQAYGYTDWNTTTQHYHIHVVQ